jgi:hypothetical protein
MKRLLVVAALAAVAVHAGAEMPAKKAASFASTTKARAVQALKDPESAKFRGLFVSQSEPLGDSQLVAPILCGEVNAKNSYGGYVGFRRFYALESGRMTIEQDGDAFDSMWSTLCSRKQADVR